MNNHTTDLFALAAAATFFGLFSLLAQTASALPPQTTPQPQQTQPAPQPQQTQTTPQLQQTQATTPVLPHSARTKIIGVELFANSGMTVKDETEKGDLDDTSGTGFAIRFGANVLKREGFQLIPEGRLQYSSMDGEFGNADVEWSSMNLSAGLRAGGFLQNTPVGGFVFFHAGVSSSDFKATGPGGTLRADGRAKTAEAGITLNYAVSELVGIGLVASRTAAYTDEIEFSWTNLGLHTEFRF